MRLDDYRGLGGHIDHAVDISEAFAATRRDVDLDGA
jgi:hypothetical protein